MSVRTVLDDDTCAACDADQQPFTRGQAYVAGLVLAMVNGPEYVAYELANFCKRHRAQFERNRKALEDQHDQRAKERS
jgi:hypothetical protein